MTTIDFEDDDAWIFWAIPANDKGTDLRGVISAADALNHAIPSREQIESSINRGLRAGLLEICGELFRFVPAHRAEIKKATSADRFWHRQWDNIYAYLTSREWRVVESEEYRLDKEVYDATVAEYIRTF